ncbi:MAG TPA: carbohydrate porin [Acetobacteraceae bacterium]|nr:carbohydrate porin [Acetobacteraceae bacterium]
MPRRLVCATALLLAGQAWADDGPNYQSNLFGDMAGLRPTLANAGLTLTASDTSEVLGNPTGGVRNEAIFEGAGFASLGFDAGQVGLLQGFTAQVSAWGIYGRGLTGNAIDNLNIVSNLEADRSLRLFELWVEQSFADGRISLRIGQQAADQEFMIDPYATPLINAEFGFPLLPSLDMPSGGPAYPLATPAVRLTLRLTNRITLLAALYNGDPAPPVQAGNPVNDPQARDNAGTNFRIDAGAMWFAELQYAYSQGEHAAGEPGTVKIGAWYNTDLFADQRLDASGRSLADPSSSGHPLLRSRDWSIYALVNQQVWQGGGVFLRVMGAPGDRNLIDYNVDGGLNLQGILASRPNDTLALGFVWGHVGTAASKLDGDIGYVTGHPYPVRRWEPAFEATYQAQLTPWWQVQPDCQYIVRPGGGLPYPAGPARPIGDALVLGARSLVTF